MISKLDDVREVLSAFKTREFFGVDALVDGANELITKFNSARPKDKIEKLNVRTVRYYLSDQSGPLLASPTAKMGQLLVFGYKEFVSLIAIKWFQAQGLQLSVIRAAIRETSLEKLEKAIGEPIKVFANRAEMNAFVSASGEKLEDNFSELRDPVAMRDFLDERNRKEEKKPSATTDGLWKRLTIADGLELNLGADFKKPRTKAEREALVKKIERAVDEID